MEAEAEAEAVDGQLEEANKKLTAVASLLCPLYCQSAVFTARGS